jgi:hypothetical protein
MIQPLMLWSSLAIPWPPPAVESYSTTRPRFYITAPVAHPVVPAGEPTWSDRPMSNQDLIQEWNETLLYKGLDETF